MEHTILNVFQLITAISYCSFDTVFRGTGSNNVEPHQIWNIDQTMCRCVNMVISENLTTIIGMHMFSAGLPLSLIPQITYVVHPQFE